MILSINGDKLQIEWEWFEQLFGVNVDKTWTIPLSHITNVSTDEPPSSWTELRMPGTYFPGVIKAGTYYTNRGREFWYVTRDTNYLVLELQDESYRKIVLTLDSHKYWQSQILSYLSGND